jgi:hypothetical protein
MARRRHCDEKTAPQRFDRAEVVQKAVALRRAGASYDQIAAALGLKTRGGAYKIVKKGLDDIPREDVELLRRLWDERFDAILRGGLYERARNGDLKAIDRVIAINARHCRMNGVDAPIAAEIEHSGGISHDVNAQDELIERIAAIAKRLGEASEALAGAAGTGPSEPQSS